jgi:hypothetical protein
MKPLKYILGKTLKNIIKELKKKPLILIGYVFVILAFLIMAVISIFIPYGAIKNGSIENYGMIISAVLIGVFYFDVKQGIDSGSSFFRLADVNFVFTAPISPKHVLLYGFVKQFFKTFYMLLFLSFQIPNLKNSFPIDAAGIIIIYTSTFFLFFTMPIIGMLIYSITSKSRKMRENFQKGLNAVIYLSLGCFILLMFQTKDFGKAAALILNSEYFTLIPYIGWFKAILLCAVTGIDHSFYLNVALVSISTVLMVIAVYRMKTDYYEDVLAATEKMEEFLKVRKEGKIGSGVFKNTKLKRVKHTYRGNGAKTIFMRHMLEYRKTGLFFIGRNTAIIFVLGLGAKNFFPDISIIAIFCLLFFFSMQGKWVRELDKPYIYLIPAGSTAKVFYATLAENLKNGVDGLVLFAAAGIVYRFEVITIILCAIAYMTYGAIYIYGDVLTRRIFGATHSRNFEIFMKMFLVAVVMAPGIFIAVLFNFVFGILNFNTNYTYLILIAYNLSASFLILYLCRGIFRTLEMK